MEIYINGIGIIAGFGVGVDRLVQCLNSGDIPKIELPNTNIPDNYYPSYIADTSCLTDFVPKRELRRIDHFSQLALTGAFLTLKDAGIERLDSKKTGLVICSGYGSSRTTFSFLDSIIDNGDECASPTLFSNSVHNSAAGHISILLGLSGPCLTVSQFEMSVHSALISASIWLNEGRADQILFGAVDEICEVLKYSYNGFFGKREDYPMTPLAPECQSAVPGEGAVFFMLSKEKSTCKKYGFIESVKTGSISEIRKELSAEVSYIVNAGGHKECDTHYAEIIPVGSAISCYTPLYGCMPVGAAFDMAIASLCFNKGEVFSSPDDVVDLVHLPIEKKTKPVKRCISCIKTGRHGESGIINMSNNGL